MNARQTMQIGTKLVRTFGEGTKAKHVVTESINNTTKTQVFDAFGEKLKGRTKTITRGTVGDKFYISKEIDYSDGEKTIIDTVYDKLHNFLGKRAIYYPGKLKIVTLANGDIVDTFYEKGVRGERIFHDNGHHSLVYTYEGLPIPPELFTVGKYLKDFAGKSLKEMLQECKDIPFPEWARLSKVDIGGFNIVDFVKNIMK